MDAGVRGRATITQKAPGVISGLDVVDKIRVVPTSSKGMHDDVPMMPVTINKATIEK